MQRFEKPSFFFVEIGVSVTAASFLYGEPHGRWPPPSYSTPEKSTSELGILVGGSFQPVAGQLMQLLATIIGHHGSPDASGIFKHSFYPVLSTAQVSSHKYLFSFLLHQFDFHRNGKALNYQFF